MINKKYMKVFLLLSLMLLVFVVYLMHHLENIKKNEVKLYDNMIKSLDENDLISVKYYAKNIVKINTKSLYYDVSCFLLYNIEKKKRNELGVKFLRDKIIMNNNSLFNKIIKDEANEKNIKR